MLAYQRLSLCGLHLPDGLRSGPPRRPGTDAVLTRSGRNLRARAPAAATGLVGSPAYSQSGSDVVSVVDPPGVKGYLAGSGGQNPPNGILLYWWGAAEPGRVIR